MKKDAASGDSHDMETSGQVSPSSAADVSYMSTSKGLPLLFSPYPKNVVILASLCDRPYGYDHGLLIGKTLVGGSLSSK